MGNLDVVDRKILVQLQEDAVKSLDKILQKVKPSKSPVWNRISKMCEDDFIGAQTDVPNTEALRFDACFYILMRTIERLA